MHRQWNFFYLKKIGDQIFDLAGRAFIERQWGIMSDKHIDKTYL